MPHPSLPPEFFLRYDDRDDSLFYAMPRKVVHIDQCAIAAVGSLYYRLLPPGGAYLDLMSSWRSHLPVELYPSFVIGLGMNAAEMADNPQLTDYLVHDLNATPSLPFDDAQFDAVVCTVSVQYLLKPIEVFNEVNRVLRPGGVFAVTFSNRTFATKAIAVWLQTTDTQRMALVDRYFQDSGNWHGINADSIQAHRADPVFAVWAYRER